jgi:SAM-dependent methyltransferase
MQRSLFAKRLYRIVLFLGFDPIRLISNISGIGWYVRDYLRLSDQLKKNSSFKKGLLYPILNDKRDNAGSLPKHYFKQDVLVAQIIFANSPHKHVDIGSRIDGFVAHVAAYRPIEVIDIRPFTSDITNISFLQIDFMQPIPVNYHNYTDSVSCLHAIEHFGLGRYGDPIDANGYIKGYENLIKLLKPGGILYFSTPIGEQRIEFNAHRIFSVNYLLQLFDTDCTVEDFYYIDDKELLHHPLSITKDDAANNFGCRFGCGIFILKKKNV